MTGFNLHVAASGPPASPAGVDLAIVGVAVVLLFVISYVFGREEKNTNDFFLGGRRVPAVVACLSFVAAEISALTIVGFPATAYAENWAYLQFLIGGAAARIMVAYLFIPIFYKYDCTSIYEFLRHRFGPETQLAGSVFFFLTRLVASGIRLYAACLGVGLIMGWTLLQSLLLFSVVSIIFIAFGGVKAVVWAGAYQAVMFIIAGVVLLVYLSSRIEGGFAQAWEIAGREERLQTFSFAFDAGNSQTFWAMAGNAFFIGLASFGADQEMMQRLLTVRTRKKSQRTLISTIITVIPITCLYLAIGTLLFVFYKQNPNLPGPERAKEVLSHFVAHSLPQGLKGLMLAAIVMASIDSPLSSLASSFVTDIYRPLLNRNASEKHYLLVSRTSVVMFGVVLAAIALACDPIKNILWFAYQMFSVTGGAILGVFLLGLLTKRRVNRANIAAMTAGAFLSLTLLLLDVNKVIHFPWTWLIVVSTGTTFAVGYIAGIIVDLTIED